MDKRNEDPTKLTLRKLVFNIIRAATKGVLVYAIYFVVWSFVSPVAQANSSFQQSVGTLSIGTFVAIYIALLVVGELTSGTVYHYVFDNGRAIFVVGYLISSLNTGIVGGTFNNLTYFVDLRLFLTIATLLSLLGLAKSMLQTISFLNQKAEYAASL